MEIVKKFDCRFKKRKNDEIIVVFANVCVFNYIQIFSQKLNFIEAQKIGAVFSFLIEKSYIINCELFKLKNM